MGYFEDEAIDVLIDDNNTEYKFSHNRSCHSYNNFNYEASHTVVSAPSNNSEREPLNS